MGKKIEKIRIGKTRSQLRALELKTQMGPASLITIPASGFWKVPHEQA